jgi:CubicO group peptidase (beta-lactamase class C family)
MPTHEETLSTITDPRFRLVCEEVIAGMLRCAVPGVSVGVYCEGQEQIAGFGVTSVENPLPVTPDTLFQVGSISKTFTTTALLRLVEMGRLELDKPVRTYLPELRLSDESVAARVTLRHLLTHTAGWLGDYFNDYGSGEDALVKIVASLVDLPQLTPLGEVWSYNNAAFYVAGRLVEIASGKPYETALQELVLDPLGLHSSYFFADDVITRRFVVGHTVSVVDGKRTPSVARPWPIGRAGNPIGGLVSTVGDLFRYARFHMGDGTVPSGPGAVRLLKPETLALMQTVQATAGGRGSIGLSWFINDAGGETVISHGGATNGQEADLRLVPSRGFAVAVLTNSDDGGMLNPLVCKTALKAYLGLEYPQHTPLDLPPEYLTPYAGLYEAHDDLLQVSLVEPGPGPARLKFHFTYKGGFPTPDSPPSRPPESVRAALYAEDRLICLDDPYKDSLVDVLRGSDGAITWLRLGGRIHKRIAD